MSDGLNRVLLLGNLGADPELKVFPTSTILRLRMACSESYYDKSTNTRKEKTEWVSVAVWGNRGEALAKFLKKGDRIFVEGSLRTSTYEVDGQKRYRTEVVASNIILNGTGARHTTKKSPDDGDAAPPPPAEDFGGFEHEDSDIPF